jgi:dTDP-4-amino-4,6-dideoxygalactose transaminase
LSTATHDPLPYGHQDIDDSDIEAVVEVLRGEWLTTGPAVAAFEEALEHRTGSPTVAVSSGTAALHAAYAALPVRAGDEVVSSPLTFVATASTAAIQGAKLVFADVEEDTGNLDPLAVAAAMSQRTAAVAAVDYAGHPAELDALLDVAHEWDALLLEDAAHSIGSLWNGRPVGSIADLTTFSFFPTKNVTTAEGGAVAVRDHERLDRVRRFRNHGLVREPDRLRNPGEGGWHQEVHTLGLNYRLPDVLAALGTSQLKRLSQFKARRRQIVQAYNNGLVDIDAVVTPLCRAGADPMWHLYPLRVRDDRRRELYDTLRSSGILVQVNFVPAYWHPVFEDLGYRRGMCPRAEQFYAEQISLPLFPAMSDADVERVISAVRSFFAT